MKEMLKKFLLAELIGIVLIAIFFGVYVGYTFHPAISGFLTMETTVTSSMPDPSIPVFVDGFQPDDQIKWTDDYAYGADEYKLIVAGVGHAYYCKIVFGYESPNRCYLFLEKDGAYVATRLVAQDVNSTILLSPDKMNIALIEPNRILVIRVADDQRRELYTAKHNEVLGYYSNTNFYGQARWLDGTALEVNISDKEHAGESDQGSFKTISLTI